MPQVLLQCICLEEEAEVWTCDQRRKYDKWTVLVLWTLVLVLLILQRYSDTCSCAFTTLVFCLCLNPETALFVSLVHVVHGFCDSECACTILYMQNSNTPV